MEDLAGIKRAIAGDVGHGITERRRDEDGDELQTEAWFDRRFSDGHGLHRPGWFSTRLKPSGYCFRASRLSSSV